MNFYYKNKAIIEFLLFFYNRKGVFVLKLVPHILKKTAKVVTEKPQVFQQNQALLKEQLKSLDTFVSSQAPIIKTSQVQALSKIAEFAQTVEKLMPKK